MGIAVRHATETDLEAVFEISRSLGDEREPQKGFLVSDYSMDTYQSFFASSHEGPKPTKVYFLIAHDA